MPLFSWAKSRRSICFRLTIVLPSPYLSAKLGVYVRARVVEGLEGRKNSGEAFTSIKRRFLAVPLLFLSS